MNHPYISSHTIRSILQITQIWEIPLVDTLSLLTITVIKIPLLTPKLIMTIVVERQIILKLITIVIEQQNIRKQKFNWIIGRQWIDIYNENKFRETQLFYACKSWNKKFCRNK
jgi:hypothetical protein